MSTFGKLESDAIGENGKSDPNRAGDCATRGDDNAPFHQKIRVRNLDNNMVTELRKNDNGQLPYAVLDIYKWSGNMMDKHGIKDLPLKMVGTIMNFKGMSIGRGMVILSLCFTIRM